MAGEGNACDACPRVDLGQKELEVLLSVPAHGREVMVDSQILLIYCSSKSYTPVTCLNPSALFDIYSL